MCSSALIYYFPLYDAWTNHYFLFPWHRPVPQCPLQLREWGSGRRPCCVAVHSSPIYLTVGRDTGPPSSLPAWIQTPFQTGQPKPLPSLCPDRNQEEELKAGSHEAEHQVLDTASCQRSQVTQMSDVTIIQIGVQLYGLKVLINYFPVHILVFKSLIKSTITWETNSGHTIVVPMSIGACTQHLRRRKEE